MPKDSSPDCPKCGKARTVLQIREALSLDGGRDVVEAVIALRNERDRLARYVANLPYSLAKSFAET